MAHPETVCPADVFHRTVEEIVIAAMEDCPGITHEFALASVLQAMLMMAIPAGNC